ncbi:PiggyBac transposable element-derived protein [Trinorchestia longiramus]|nr:PiggyBac transposable element-derived protein [Trinorchestia longiramus]
MLKFKGRSSKKQYMPMKNTKRGIKLWVRSCAETAYVYDFDIYSGKADNDSGKLKQKDGTKADVPCPDSIALYNRIMGGVDLSDEKGKLYDFNRKSIKWWKKVFYRLLLFTVVNAWILYQEVNHLKIPLLDFMVPLAEKLIACGDKMSAIKKKSAGRRSSALSSLVNISDHLPFEGDTRRCCFHCAREHQKDKRTKTLCTACQIPLCKAVFHPLPHEVED